MGDAVVVWLEVPPSRTPRKPAVRSVDHVGPKTFTVTGLDATFNRSTGRSKTVRTGGELSARTYVAAASDSGRGLQVVGDDARRSLEQAAVTAVQAWLASRGEQDRVAAVEALQALDGVNP